MSLWTNYTLLFAFPTQGNQLSLVRLIYTLKTQTTDRPERAGIACPPGARAPWKEADRSKRHYGSPAGSGRSGWPDRQSPPYPGL